MVKFAIVLWLMCVSALAITSEQKIELFDKVKAFTGEQVFLENERFISIIFSDGESYFKNGRLDVVVVVQTLKENGLLELFFDHPKTFSLSFRASGAPIFFVKLMQDTLQSMGYFRFVTAEVQSTNDAFIWKVNITSEYLTDPVVFKEALAKHGCSIVDIEIKDPLHWEYEIDSQHGYLDVPSISPSRSVTMHRFLDAHWLNVHTVKRLRVTSLKGNYWYPYIAYYDRSMRLLKVYKRDSKTYQISLNLPKSTYYIKFDDLYTLKNMKNGLQVEAFGRR